MKIMVADNDLVITFSRLEVFATGFRRRLIVPLDKIVSAELSTDKSELPHLFAKLYGVNAPNYLAGVFLKDKKRLFIVHTHDKPFLLIKTQDYHYPTIILNHQGQNADMTQKLLTLLK
ncbi:hypothetical protein [Pseudolactococcus reticulitermitis]|uniref:Bacterial Pleckstrin homology domain-containing protein n=1 Tax=Pseudolactococcus reticulitermitis TaxID=2025039 RepID=A0A224XBH9_9LACT|nr:hypothetical protein [Lactococcus reticulitermitis]GAX47055.1 hypothetical protein RsY01_636 [Lactococcus reticulitermitis]